MVCAPNPDFYMVIFKISKNKQTSKQKPQNKNWGAGAVKSIGQIKGLRWGGLGGNCILQVFLGEEKTWAAQMNGASHSSEDLLLSLSSLTYSRIFRLNSRL